MAKLFGTDGIRGVANLFPMTPEFMVKIGYAAGNLLPKAPAGVIIGRDSRHSGQMLEYALASGIVASGTHVLFAGIIPTPAVAFLTRKMNAQAGIVISASHNPAQDNGIKIFASSGFKISDELETAIETAALSAQMPFERPIGGNIGRIRTLPDAAEQYINSVITSVFGAELPDFSGMKAVIDYANGAAAAVSPAAFRRLGLRTVELANEPDGLNINLDCGALHTETLQARVRAERADLGIAFDGDADRLILIDETGARLDGDQILTILAFELASRQELTHNILVATILSNLGLEVAMREAGMTLMRTAVGDRYVSEKMREVGAVLGGEQSGHILMFGHSTTGDGLLTALAILKILQASGKPLSELAQRMPRFPQLMINTRVNTRKPFEEMPRVMQAIRAAEQELGKRGRVVVRYSGTELLARVMVEAEHGAIVQRIAEEIIAEIQQENR